MLLTINPVTAEALATLSAPVGLPAGAALQVITMEADLSGEAGYKVIASLLVGPEVSSATVAAWLWPQIAGPLPPVVGLGGRRARIGEEAALGWLIDHARCDDG